MDGKIVPQIVPQTRVLRNGDAPTYRRWRRLRRDIEMPLARSAGRLAPAPRGHGGTPRRRAFWEPQSLRDRRFGAHRGWLGRPVRAPMGAGRLRTVAVASRRRSSAESPLAAPRLFEPDAGIVGPVSDVALRTVPNVLMTTQEGSCMPNQPLHKCLTPQARALVNILEDLPARVGDLTSKASLADEAQ